MIIHDKDAEYNIEFNDIVLVATVDWRERQRWHGLKQNRKQPKLRRQRRLESKQRKTPEGRKKKVMLW